MILIKNSEDNKGRTALVWAILGRHEAVVRLLLSRDGIDVNIRDKTGRTSLVWAKSNVLSVGDSQVFVELLEQKWAVL